MSSVIQQFLQATSGEKASILKDDGNIDLLVAAIIDDLQDTEGSERYKVVVLVSVLEENIVTLLSKPERFVPG